ncbi:MAG: hypothetical protein V4654_03810 [Bdellovibrionota bacterium]
MKKLLLLVLLFPMSSWALFTARATYTGVVAKDALKDVCAGTSCEGVAPDMVPLYGLGADVIVKLPLIPIGFGIRTEKLGLDVNKNGVEGEASLNRTAALINYRFIDTIIHFGLIGSYGVDHSANIRVAQSGSNVVDYSGGSLKSYSLGLELEVKPLIIIPLIVGAETGIMNTKWKGATNSVNSTTKDIDLSGTYIKFFLGIDI